MKNTQKQVFLSDKMPNGKEKPWREKKIKNEFLRDSYFRIGLENKAFRMEQCGSYLAYRDVLGEDKPRKILHSADFCKVRLCPMCAYRRASRIYNDLSKVVEEIKQMGMKFIFLTLTCKNVYGGDLDSAIDSLIGGQDRLFKRTPVKNVVQGHFRVLEVTHDTEMYITKSMYKQRKDYYDTRGFKVGDLNPNYNMYHPHFHVMLAVDKNYFPKRSKGYIDQEQWVDLWQKSLRVDYKPIVDVRTVRNEKHRGISEVAKYTVKDSDYLIAQNEALTDETVLILESALANRRLIAYGGKMKEIHRAFGLKENVSPDIYTDEGEGLQLSNEISVYNWHIGYKNYVLVNKILYEGE